MTPAVRQIVRQVLPHFGLELTEPEELERKDRHKSIAQARQVAMWVARRVLRRSFPELGREFGNRDHTTCMSAVRRVERAIERDPLGPMALAARAVLVDAVGARPVPGLLDSGARDLEPMPGLAQAIELAPDVEFELAAVGAE